MAASVVLAETVYDVSCNVILDSAMRAISAWDVVTSMIKCWVFGTIISAGGRGACRCRCLLRCRRRCCLLPLQQSVSARHCVLMLPCGCAAL